MEFQCQGTADGRLDFGPYNRAKFAQFLQEHPGIRLKITAELPESGKLRRFYEGAVVPLITFYQEGMDHRDGEDRRKVREWLKQEFNGELVEIGGKVQRIGKTTKGRPVLNQFVERVIDWLTENYAPPQEALDPERYKIWRDTIFPSGGPDNYIGYLIELNLLRRV
jgi:hypothetical protein